jgi:hypothetical protein
VCRTWAQVGKTCGPLMTSATIDAAEYAMRRGHRLDWTAASHWLNRHLHGRPTLSLRFVGCLNRIAKYLRPQALHARRPRFDASLQCEGNFPSTSDLSELRMLLAGLKP